MSKERNLCIIPARGGSKGIPDKNIRLLHGKALIGYTIEAAKELFAPMQIMVSTDSESIRSVAEQFGIAVDSLRPAELATDTASSYDVILHCMEEAEASGLNFDTIILLQPTSPLRTSHHIREAMALFREGDDMVVSVKRSEENPYYSLFEEDPDGFLSKSKEGNFTRRQDCPEVYAYNGAIYIMNAQSLRKMPLGSFSRVRKYIMSDEDSIDIDSPLDLKIAELILSEREK